MLQIYGLDSEGAFAASLAQQLNVPLARHELRGFEDGEFKVRPTTDPRGADAYVVLSLYGDAHCSPQDKLCRLLMFMAALQDHGAARVTAVTPYLAYARKDQQTKPFDPVSLRYVAQWLELAGARQLFVLEAHNLAALQNAFRRPMVHVHAHSLFEAIARELSGEGPLAVASPDVGGVKRAQLWREALQIVLSRPVGFAMIDKRRSAGVVSSDNLVAGEVKGMTVLLLDDLIASGDTMRRGAVALRRAGASKVIVCAAHGLFTGDATHTLSDESIAKLVVTDSVPTFRIDAQSALRSKLVVVSAAPCFAQAIALSHRTWARRSD